MYDIIFDHNIDHQQINRLQFIKCSQRIDPPLQKTKKNAKKKKKKKGKNESEREQRNIEPQEDNKNILQKAFSISINSKTHHI
jgi:DNA-binding transcriptional MerR regulator